VSPEEFEKIVCACRQPRLWVISDECYCQLFTNRCGLFRRPNFPRRCAVNVLVAGSLSKTYAMTGWRIGYALGPREWIKR